MSEGIANETRLDRFGPWRALRKRVMAEEPVCWLRLPGCTIKSDTADHVKPKSIRPDLILVRSSVRGACRQCNSVRGNRMRVGQPARNEQVAAFFNPRTSRSSGDVGKLTTPF